MVAILEMATVSHHAGFSKFKTQYSVSKLSKTYESTLR